jgi:uroporphyrinogen decarboxylase
VNPRQRFLETLTFGNPDKIPFSPGGPRESTLAAWHEQGLPENRPFMEVVYEELGFAPEQSEKPKRGPYVSFVMIPTFEEEVLEHRDGHYIVRDWMGAITEISDTYDYTYIRTAKDFVTRKWHKWPVENRDDWEDMKWRYDPDAPGRFPDDFEERCADSWDRDNVISLNFNGPFWQLREWCGMEGLCLLMVEQPDFVHEMAEFWTEFCSTCLGRITSCMQVDCITLNEDMAYKAHSMISPEMVRAFLMPFYQRLREESRSRGCPLMGIDSDGYIGELLPLWLECDVRLATPMEVAAHNDLVEYRRLYGREMAYTGGLDKRALARGGKVMEAELARVIPPLFEEGGFIPSCDHGVPPDISWPNFLEYSRLLAQYTGWL